MNRTYLKYIIFILILITISQKNSFSQMDYGCKQFTKNGLVHLDTATYRHDGRYNSVQLTPGESFEVYKPFYKGRDYKMVVFADEQLPEISFKLVDIQGNEIYSSPVKKGVISYVYSSPKSQNLIISIKVEGGETETDPENKTIDKSKQPTKKTAYCVALLVGSKN